MHRHVNGTKQPRTCPLGSTSSMTITARSNSCWKMQDIGWAIRILPTSQGPTNGTIHMEHLHTHTNTTIKVSDGSWYSHDITGMFNTFPKWEKMDENGYLVIYHPAMTPSATIQACGSSPATACRKPCSFRGAAPLAETARCKVGSASCAKRWVKSCTAWKVEGHRYFWCEWKWIMISSQLRWHWHDRIMSCRSMISFKSNYEVQSDISRA